MMYPFEDDRMLVIVCVVVVLRTVCQITSSNCLMNIAPVKKKNHRHHRKEDVQHSILDVNEEIASSKINQQ